MAIAQMTWVCVCLTLAQINNVATHRGLAGQDEQSDGNEQHFEVAAPDRTERSFHAPAWHFLEGSGKSQETSDFNQPQYRFSNGTLSLRFSLIRYTNLHLEGGAGLSLRPDRCHGSINRWWLLGNLPYTGCFIASQTGDGPLKVHYFDRLLQKNMTGKAVCEKPAMSPLVTCRATHVIVRLPGETTKLKKVKELDIFMNKGYLVKQQKASNALFVEVSKFPDVDSGFELLYVDSTGKLCTVLAACSTMMSKVERRHVKRHHVKRSLEEPDVFDLWGFEDIPVEPFNPELTQTTTTQTTKKQTTANSATTRERVNDSGIYSLWGFEEIPEEPYTGIDAEVTAPTTTAPTTAAPTTACSHYCGSNHRCSHYCGSNYRCSHYCGSHYRRSHYHGSNHCRSDYHRSHYRGSH
ncbi:hypothetical protein PBY51_022252 [Eleginops maclovinus]|uniref:C2H2-type domain-containing protein n=1 Tax=Eleginops maclovinus TaxID=56733 RepID=A0AAN7XHF3_ELEMC|nr:hypothetical protein PBY51_022252 [Eleginops maclovinus]